MRLTAASLHEVLQPSNRLLSHVTTQIHLVELLLCHLHQLPLVLNLSLSQLKRVIGDHVGGHDLSCVLAGHHQIFLGLLVLKVAVGQRGLNLASCVVLD